MAFTNQFKSLAAVLKHYPFLNRANCNYSTNDNQNKNEPF
jgi:hypothetical protein